MTSANSTGSHSVTVWLNRLKGGDSLAAHKLWTMYLSRLVLRANKRLGNRRLRLGDSDDVATIAFASFLKCVKEERFPRLDDRDDLWQVLMMLTDRKARDHLDLELAAKRGSGQLVGESAVSPALEGDRAPNLEWMAANGPSPEFALQVAEEFQILFQKLDDKSLEKIAQAKLEGFTNREIAEREKISLRSVERRLALIRSIWKSECEDG